MPARLGRGRRHSRWHTWQPVVLKRRCGWSLLSGWGAGPSGLCASYTLCRPRQPCAVTIRNASSTDLATPAIPPAAWTVSSHACCSGRMRPVGVFTSMLVKTATCWPTMSGVIVMVRYPIRSALPLHRPNCTGLPCWSLSVPVLLRKSLVAPVEQAMRMRCWMDCSLAAAGIHNVFGPRYRVLVPAAVA